MTFAVSLATMREFYADHRMMQMLSSFRVANRKMLGAALALGLVLTGPALAQEQTRDPLEKVNRVVFAFNSKLDRFLIRPVARNYRKIVPPTIRKGVSNVLSNFDDLTVIVNDVLQLKFDQALEDSGRFLLNSTVGIAGVFDVAGRMGLHKNYEDFGQTLGYWGVPAGPYIEVPILGGYNLRDGFGAVPDLMTNPAFYISHNRTRNQVFIATIIDARVSFMPVESMVRGDRYSFIRDAYIQRREYLVADGEMYDDFDDF